MSWLRQLVDISVTATCLGSLRHAAKALYMYILPVFKCHVDVNVNGYFLPLSLVITDIYSHCHYNFSIPVPNATHFYSNFHQIFESNSCFQLLPLQKLPDFIIISPLFRPNHIRHAQIAQCTTPTLNTKYMIVWITWSMTQFDTLCGPHVNTVWQPSVEVIRGRGFIGFWFPLPGTSMGSNGNQKPINPENRKLDFPFPMQSPYRESNKMLSYRRETALQGAL